MSDIRIAAFGDQPIKRGWIVEGMPCATYASLFGGINGYVRLPVSHPDLLLAHAAEALPPTPFVFAGRRHVNIAQGYDYIDVEVPGGWTYGPDDERWIGFDTLHAQDYWTHDQRRENVADDPEAAAYLEFLLDIETRYGLDQPRFERWRRPWTAADVEAEVETAARILAMRARAAIREMVRRMSGD